MSLLLLLGNIGFAEATQSKAQMEDFKKIFKSGTHNGIIEGQNCSWKCQEVNGDFVTQITGYNFKNGTTFCQIFARENLDKPLIYNANAQNLRCIDEIYGLKNPTADNLLNNNLKKDIQIESAIEYAPNDSKITLSKFLTSLVTLNPDIIDREKTSQLGQLTLKDGLEQYSVESIDKPDSNRGNYEQTIINQMKSLINSASDAVGIKVFEDKYNKTSAIDGFNKNNMAYFNDLFINMEKIYQHLQILLFIVVGGFYLSSIGANKLQTYLESRGESESNQPYLHKFYIPLLMVGTFFMPIPEANGLAHSTIVQNTIRYFTIQSTEIADMASAIGGKTYMDKIYKSIGGINSDGIESLYNDWRVAKYTYEKGIENYEKTCKERYSKLTTQDTPTNFMRLSDKQKEELSQTVEEDRNQKAGTEYDITIGACMQLESQINSAKKKQEFLEAQFSGIQDFMNGNRESEELKALDLYFAGREKQLGWINSIFTPSSALLAELITYKDEAIVKNDMKTSTERNTENLKQAIDNREVSEAVDEDSTYDTVISFIAGRLAWMVLPGAEQLKEFIGNMFDMATSIITKFINSVVTKAPALLAGAIAGDLVQAIFTAGKVPLVYYATSLLIEDTFAKIPLLVLTTCSTIAFVSYIVSLCKYFYISPFVVAFALATKRTSKIVDFLVTGIAIFFKPILIILFIYLALFVHTLISELFTFISVEQFQGVNKGLSPLVIFTTGAICGLLKIFAALASSYIIWKLVISGPNWALSLVGIDGKQDDMISQGIEQQLARRAFVA